MIVEVEINKRWPEEFVINRIAQIVYGKTDGVRLRSEEEVSRGRSPWAINENANDWWAEFHAKKNEEGEEVRFVRLSYRYGGNGKILTPKDGIKVIDAKDKELENVKSIITADINKNTLMLENLKEFLEWLFR